MNIELIPYEVMQFKRLIELVKTPAAGMTMEQLQAAYIELAASAKAAAAAVLDKVEV